MLKINDGFYNYISTKAKLFHWLADSFFFIICAVLLWHYKTIFNDPSVSFYTFSTIVQGFLALIGFLGAVAVFKLQLVETNIQKVMDIIMPYMNAFNGVVVYGYAVSEMISEGEKIVGRLLVDGRRPDHYDEHIKIGVQKLKNLTENKDQVRNFVVDFSLLSLINIMIALLGIPFSKFAIYHGHIFLITCYMLLNIGVSYASVFSAFKLIRLCIGYSFVMRAESSVGN
jgi:hypothetical protein